MKKWKQLLAVALCLFLAVMAAGCGENNDDGNTNDDGSDDDMLNIGIVQYVEHVALDQAYEGFVDALADNGYIKGVNVNYDYQNAQNDPSNLSTISQRFTDSDLILAIATPAAQAVASETSTVPIVATAITDYAEALLVEVDEEGNALDLPGYNVTGTSDMNPIEEQIDLLIELCPDAETVGIVYSSNEPNSVIQAELAKEAAEALGLKVETATVSSPNEVQQVTASIASKVDAIYIPTDNVYAASMPIVEQVCVPAGIPTICGESGMVETGGFATLGINYYDLGYETGLMAVEILKGNAEPASMPIKYAESYSFTINGDVADALGIEIPEKYADAVIYPSQENDTSDDDSSTDDNSEEDEEQGEE